MEIIRLLYRRVKRRFRLVMLQLHRRHLLKYINGGEGLYLEDKIMLIYPDRLTLGRNVHIGKDAYFNCRGGVTIGDHTIISRRVTIYSYDHNFKKPGCLPFDEKAVNKPVHIGRYVWVGMGVTIAPGTKVGDGAVLGLGTVVSGNIPENAIVVSPHLRIVGYRDENHTRKLVGNEEFYKYPSQD